MVSAGQKFAKVTAHALGRAGTGNEQIAISFDVEGEGSITWYGYFTDAAYKTTERALIALGWNPEENNYAFDQLNETEILVGAEAMLVCEDDEDQEGRPVVRVRWVNSPNGGGVALKERLTAEEASSFAANLRKRIIATKGPGASKARPAAGRAPARRGAPAAAAVEDDIPF